MSKVVQIVSNSSRYSFTYGIYRSQAAARSTSVCQLVVNVLSNKHRSSTFTRRITMSTTTKKKTIDISAVEPPIATPFDDHQNIDFDKRAGNFKLWNYISLRGCYNTTHRAYAQT